MKKVLPILYLLIGVTAHAQHWSKEKRFSIAHSRGCAPVTISITSHYNHEPGIPTYSYEGEEPANPNTFHTYTEPGHYQIVELAGPDADPQTDTLEFEILSPTTPEFNVFRCTSTEVQVEITDQVYDFYEVRFTEDVSVMVESGDPPVTHDYDEPNGTVEVTGFYNDSYPNCGSGIQTFTTSVPQPASISHADVIEICKDEFVLSLLLSADPYTRYQINFKQGSGAYTPVYEGAVQPENYYPVNFSPDDDLNFCVRINAINPCSNIQTEGEAYCDAIDMDRLRPLGATYAGYMGKGILINLDVVESGEVTVERKRVNEADYAFLRVATASFVDEVPSMASAFDYKLSQSDTCGNSIDSAIVSAPFLNITNKNISENSVRLEASDPVNGLGDFEKLLLFYNSDSSLTELIPFAEVVVLPADLGSRQNIRTVYQYQDRGIILYSNEQSSTYNVRVFVPKAFTPNNDGLNDELELFGLPTNAFEISIYNRWGELIRRSDTNPVWTGYLREEKAPQGTYRYKLIFTLADGEVKTQVGTFVLLKN